MTDLIVTLVFCTCVGLTVTGIVLKVDEWWEAQQR